MAGGKIDILVEPDTSNFSGQMGRQLSALGAVASRVGRGIGLAIGAGTAAAAVGLRSTIRLGKEYTANLNTLGAVTQATGTEMVQLSARASELGADLGLPATSAADAAAAMVALAKGGFDVQDSMEAARGTILLAAAAQVTAAEAAQIQSSAINQFQLAAEDAERVADILANTANSASGGITDIAYALKYVGPIAASMSIPIEDAATAIGLLAQNGIIGEQAGTVLRGVLVSLTAPSRDAANALDQLGVVAYDAQGQFVGVREVIEQLADAQARMSEEAFNAAAATAFGREPLSGITALATSGTQAFDDMADAVGRVGGAADLAGAQMIGLGGAWDKFVSQVQGLQIGVYDAIEGPLERATVAAAEWVDSVTPGIVAAVEGAVAAGEMFGPELADAIESRVGLVEGAVSDLLGPIASGLGVGLNEVLNSALAAFDDLASIAGNVVAALAPVAEGIGDVVSAATGSGGILQAMGGGLDLVGSALSGLSTLLVPIGNLVGGLAGAFAALPGPIQTAVAAMLLLRMVRPQVDALASSVSGRLTSAYQGLQDRMRVQAQLQAMESRSAAQSGAQYATLADRINATAGVTRNLEVSQARLAGSFGAISAAVPVVGAMADAYDRGADAGRRWSAEQDTAARSAAGLSGSLASASASMGGMVTAATGAARAVGSGLRTAVVGLAAALGGPWGLAIGAAAVGLGALASSQQAAADRAREHAARIAELVDTLDRQSGATTDATRQLVAQEAASSGLLATVSDLGLSTETYVDAMLGTRAAVAEVNAALREQMRDTIASSDAYERSAEVWREQGITLDLLTEAMLGNVSAGRELTLLFSQLGDVDARRLTDAMQAWDGSADGVRRLAQELGIANDRLEEAQGQARDTAAALADGDPSATRLADAMRALGDHTADADSRVRGLRDALDALNGGSLTLEQVQSRVNETLRRMSDLFGENADRTRGWGEALLNANGSINTTTENGSRLLDLMQSLSRDSAEAALRAYDLAVAQGTAVPEALDEATSHVQQARDAFLAQAQAMGFTQAQAEALADRYGLIPEEVATLISTPGMTQAQAELLILKRRADDLPEEERILTTVLSDEAVRKLRELGIQVRELPDGRVEVDVSDSDAYSRLNSFVAFARSQRVTIPVVASFSGVGGRTSYRYSGGPNIAQEHGGVVAAAYAQGGIHDLTPMRGGYAQMVPPNTWRVVGDRLRDDEAYIPINNSWRSRQILSEAARRMGFDLLRRYADGGVAQRSPREGADAVRDAVPALVGPVTGTLVLDGRIVDTFRLEIDEAGRATGTAIARGRR